MVGTLDETLVSYNYKLTRFVHDRVKHQTGRSEKNGTITRAGEFQAIPGFHTCKMRRMINPAADPVRTPIP